MDESGPVWLSLLGHPAGVFFGLLSGLVWMFALIMGLSHLVGARPVRPSDSVWTMAVALSAAAALLLAAVLLGIRRGVKCVRRWVINDRSRTENRPLSMPRLEGTVDVLLGTEAFFVGLFLLGLALYVLVLEPGVGGSYAGLSLRVIVWGIVAFLPTVLLLWGWTMLVKGTRRLGRFSRDTEVEEEGRVESATCEEISSP